MIKARPFIKCAGGKTQILNQIQKYLPETFSCYYEPFVGGGALLLDLAPKKAVINDLNQELINVYQVLRQEEEYRKMCVLLNHYETKNTEEFYYKIRNKDRNKEYYDKMTPAQRAARTIYLNKTCFNGLYRVNQKGEFNVPYNKNPRVNTYDSENLLMIHAYFNMNDITILSGDFEEAVKTATKGDFVYFDPPYDVVGNSFTSYTVNGFLAEEQNRLARVIHELDEKGVKVMLSNSNTPFIRQLYSDFHIHVIEAKRNINANGQKRGKVEEVIITNYKETLGDNLF